MLTSTGKACDNNSHASNIVLETVLFVMSYKPAEKQRTGERGEKNKKKVAFFCYIVWMERRAAWDVAIFLWAKALKTTRLLCGGRWNVLF